MSTPIFLIGPMASGKSAVGALLAGLLGTTLIDTDARVVAAHGSIPEIFAAHGEAGFRRFESEVMAAAVPTQAQRDARATAPAVLATGGGSVLAEANRELLAHGFCVYLLTDEADVAQRIGADTTRPLLGSNPLEAWSRIFAMRSDLYERLASVIIDTRGKTPGQIAGAILAAYRDAGH